MLPEDGPSAIFPGTGRDKCPDGRPGIWRGVGRGKFFRRWLRWSGSSLACFVGQGRGSWLPALPMKTASPVSQSPLRRGWQAARTNARPGLVILVIALGMLLGYRHWPAFHEALEHVRGWKLRFGFGFSAVSTAVFGGLLPLLFRLIPEQTRRDVPWRQLPFLMAFWALKGMEVDVLYRLQAAVFGDRAEWPVVVAKAFVDQFVYVPLWAVPTMVVAYAWKDGGYRWEPLRRVMGPGFYRNRCLPLLLANWGVWVPAVVVIYQLPLALQVPLQNLILCLFVLLVMILTKHDGGEIDG